MPDQRLPQAPDTAQERRDQSMSFGDQQSVVYQALIAFLGDGATDDDGCVDVWIADLATDWVVWRSWCTHGPGPGLWKLAYELGDDNAVTFTGDPEPVVELTTYVPAEAKKAPERLKAARAAMVDVETRALFRKQLRNVRETRRCPLDFELRDVPNGTGGNDLVFTGYACVTGDNATYEMEDWLGPWTESVAVGAFAKTLREAADVAFLVNHEGLTLARTKPGTLKLSEHLSGDPTGLFSEARLDPKSPHVKALRSAVERGDVDEMSFAFRVMRQEWDEDYTRRWINEVNIHQGDVSAVNFGANGHTAGTVAIRKAGTAQQVDWRTYLAALKEAREGKTLSADTMSTLRQVLDLVAAADDSVDQAQPLLAELMGVPNPDDEDRSDSSGDGNDDDESNLAADVALERLALPNHVLDARQRLAALRG